MRFSEVCFVFRASLRPHAARCFPGGRRLHPRASPCRRAPPPLRHPARQPARPLWEPAVRRTGRRAAAPPAPPARPGHSPDRAPHFTKVYGPCCSPFKTWGVLPCGTLKFALSSALLCVLTRPGVSRGVAGSTPGPPRAAAPRRHCATPPASQPAPFGSRQSGGRDGARRLPPRPLRARGIAPTAPRILPKFMPWRISHYTMVRWPSARAAIS